jgi:hypothetical protein
MNWLSLFKMFSGPLGSLVQTSLTTGAAAATAWAVAKGVPADSASVLVGAGVTAIGAIINLVTGTQAIAVSNIRSDPTNGITVVKASEARAKGVQPVADPANIG